MHREVPALIDLVSVESQEVASDAADVALLVGVRGADACLRVLAERDAVDRGRVDLLALLGVERAQAEVRHLERRRRALLDDRGLADVQLVEAAHLHVELHRAPAHAVGDREASQNRRDAEDDAQRLQRRAGEVLPHLHPGVADALAEGSVEHVAQAASDKLDQPVHDLDLALRHGGDREIVRDDDDRVALAVEVHEELEHLVARLLVERARGLVGEQQRRLVGERTRDRHALALPARKRRRKDLRLLGDADALEQLVRPLPPLLAGDAGVEHRQLHVADDGRLGQKVVLLEDEADLVVADRARARGPRAPRRARRRGRRCRSSACRGSPGSPSASTCPSPRGRSGR